MRGKRACLIVNPKEGKNLAHLKEIRKLFKDAGWKTRFELKLFGGQSMAFAKEAAERGDDLIVAYGGDGTISQVINGVMNAKGKHNRVAVGIIPGGTANVWATELGIPLDPVSAVHTLLESEVRKVDLGCVDVAQLVVEAASGEQIQDGAKTYPNRGNKKSLSKARHHFLLMAGLGVDAAVMGNVSDNLKDQVGPLAVGVSAVEKAPEQQPFRVELSVVGNGRQDEAFWNGEAIQIVIGNTRSYANIADMTPNAYIDDGILDICVIKAGDPASMTKQLLSLVLRHRPDNVTADFFHSARFVLRVPASVQMQLDGCTMRLKDYLDKPDRAILRSEEDATRVMVEYRFEAVRRALNLAIPITYDNALFEHQKDDV